jgi:hypothetical protein
MSMRRAALWLGVGIGVFAAVFAARAVAQSNPFRAWTDFVTAPRTVYRGPTLPFPDGPPRPRVLGMRACSELWPVCVHAVQPEDSARVEPALTAFEEAFSWLTRAGWPEPYPDGARGGGAEFDVYLTQDGERAVTAFADAPLDLGALDGALAHAYLDPGLPDDALIPCAVDALAQAGLLAHDPAETEGSRRAGAAYATARWSGDYGCENALAAAQHAPELGLLGDDPRQVAASALLFQLLSRRHDRDSGRFVRGAFELARQHSESVARLHARPTVWQALSAALEHAGESLDRVVEEFAIARYFAARAPGALPELPRGTAVTAAWTPPLAKLPKHVPGAEPLATYGSAYLRIDTAGAQTGMQLKIWLRGEPGVRWSLSAVRIDAAGRELGRMSAPPRRVPDSFLPVELGPECSEVLIVVTKLPAVAPDAAPAGDDDAHFFKLILEASAAGTAQR